MKYGFIGCGNMGGALIRAAAKAVPVSEIFINDANREKSSFLAIGCGLNDVDIDVIARECDFIFLGVKPQVMDEMLASIKDILDNRNDRFVLVSMAAALTIDRIKAMVGDYPVIRIMPNLAASVSEGMMLYCSKNVTVSEIEVFKNLMKHSGKLLSMEEELIDAGCAVSGCGPAFTYMYIEALAKGGEAVGLSKDEALFLAAQTVIGAATLMMQGIFLISPNELIDAVCSPGGTTIEGVKSLRKGDFYEEVKKAVEAAFKRSKEM